MMASGRALGGMSVLLVAVVPALSPATTICRWTDASGRLQVSDVVPEAYRTKAVCTDSRHAEPTPEQRREAVERAAREKEAAARVAPAAAEAPRPAPPPPAASAPRKRPAESVNDKTDCATWRRLYEESLACFGPFVTTRGAVKAEAFEVCNPVPSPDSACGPLRR